MSLASPPVDSMPNQKYNWKRFWCSQSDSIRLDGGYLPDPDSDWGHACNPKLVSFEAIADLPCLVLLGEAGMGKTTALETAHKQFFEQMKDSEDVCLPLFRLGDYGSDTELCHAIFRNNAFQAWHQGTHKLHLFFDSLDEGLLSIKILVRILKREIEDLPCDRLYFRITCRTADWASSLENKLKEKWGENNVNIYELMPLRQVDVIEAVDKNNINPDDFLREVFNKNAVPFAIKPITLKFLIDIYSQKGQLPSSQVELYDQGCLQLCEELNPDRRETDSKGRLSAKERRLLAGRVAAVMLFSRRSAVWTSPEYGKMPDSDLSLQTLCISKTEEEDFEEVFSITGLFSAQGMSHRLGFAHRTYAEFLAAWYLKQNQLKLPQILKLIIHSNDPDNRIVPQLHETVAWLASMISEVFHKVMETDPDVLLQSDVATVSEEDKVVLVESLLKLHNEEKLVYQYGTWSYKNLKHLGLANQLRPYICDADISIHARIVSIDIAKACNVQDLQEQLADLALDAQQLAWVRIKAAVAVCSMGDYETKSKLKPLAIAQPKDETEEELKGCGLCAVWSNYMSAEELFSTLTQPISNIIGGRYQRFIAKELGDHLQLSDLPIALNWLEKSDIRRDLLYPFRQVSDAIMLKAWDHLDKPDILQGFAKVASLRLRKYDSVVEDDDSGRKVPFSQLLANDDQKRHQLIESIISIIQESDKEPLWLMDHRTSIILDQDFKWLIERLQVSNVEHIERIWSKLIRYAFRYYEFEHVDAVLTASLTNLILQEEFISLIEAVELDSSTAQEAREWYLKEQKWVADQNKKKPILEPSPQERILEMLDLLDGNNPSYWYFLCREMTLEVDSTHYENPFESSLTALPGWIEAEDSTRERILRAARLYLNQGDLENQAWLGTNQLRYSALAGYQALRLLLEESPALIFSLSAEEWQKWTGIILAYPNWDRSGNREHQQELVKRAYQNASAEFVRILLKLIDQENQSNGSIQITRLVKGCWDAKLAKAIFEKVKDKALTAESVGCLLDDLLAYGVAEAKAFAETLVFFTRQK